MVTKTRNTCLDNWQNELRAEVNFRNPLSVQHKGVNVRGGHCKSFTCTNATHSPLPDLQTLSHHS